jgi:hypothetical protein
MGADKPSITFETVYGVTILDRIENIYYKTTSRRE